MTETTTISKTVFFNASRETVWAYLTEKDKLAAWFNTPKANLALGEDYCMMGKADDGADVPLNCGKVLKMDRPNLLSYTFIIGPFQDAETTVTWTLEEAAGGTRLSLVHEGIAEAAGPAAMQMLMALDRGWDKHLDSLRMENA